MRLLLVGGGVRDLLLGRPRADEDYLVLDADATELQTLLPGAKPVGRDTVAYIWHGREFCLPRGMSPTGATVEADLAARDFTVNAAALDEDGELYLHPQTMDDIKARLLRPASDVALLEDPVRCYRAARFAVTLPGFHVHPDLLQQMRRVSDLKLHEKPAAERFGKEVLKALAAPRPGRFLRILRSGRCLEPWFAEFRQAADIPAGPLPFHSESLLDHTTEVMNALAGDPLAVWMGLCHDLGKTATDPERWPRHHAHDTLGEPLAEELGKRLKLPSLYRQAGKLAAGLHMKASQYDTLRPGTRVDLLMKLHTKKVLKQLFALVVADHGMDFLDAAEQDLKAILAVHLPADKQGLGEESGRTLRDLRCMALSK